MNLSRECRGEKIAANDFTQICPFWSVLVSSRDVEEAALYDGMFASRNSILLEHISWRFVKVLGSDAQSWSTNLVLAVREIDQLGPVSEPKFITIVCRPVSVTSASATL